tara:strand:+ start:343 stop:525 length:183 start_codon:yes stop_codon:yes gene_type:complete
MQDEHLTHEWLDALDAIDIGDLKPAIELLIGANPPPDEVAYLSYKSGRLATAHPCLIRCI